MSDVSNLTSINVETLTAGTIHASEIFIGGNRLSLAPDGDLLIEGDVTLAGDLTVRNLIVLDEIKAPKVLAEKINIAANITDEQTGKSKASIGEAAIEAGQTEVIVETTAVTDKSKVFVTPTTATDKVLSVSTIVDGESFKVVITSPSTSDIKFNWWIVN